MLFYELIYFQVTRKKERKKERKSFSSLYFLVGPAANTAAAELIFFLYLRFVVIVGAEEIY